MSRKIISLIILLVAIISCSENGLPPIIAPSPDLTTVIFKNVHTNLNEPSQVQFSFRLTDTQNHAILIDENKLQSVFSIFENNQEIDYSETAFHVHPLANLELDMVLLLDFTNSMVSWQEDSVSAVNLMLDWAHDLIDEIGAAHRIAILEYHDRNSDPGIISPFTSNQQSLHDALDAFANSTIDNGSSRVWDALYSAIDYFSSAGDTTDNRNRIVVFITDGKETSSIDHTPDDIDELSEQWKSSTFIIGTGNITNEGSLRRITGNSGGEYYSAVNVDDFKLELEQIRTDLGGQYRLNYITLRSEGSYLVKVVFKDQKLSGKFSETLDLGSIYGDDRIGNLRFENLFIDENTLSTIVWADHIPRNINNIKFKLLTDKPYDIILTPSSEGGLCEDWQMIPEDINGFIELNSETAIGFGEIGALFKIAVNQVIEDNIFFEFELDNSIYSGGKKFNFEKYLIIGQPSFINYNFESGTIPPELDNSSDVPWLISDSNSYAGDYSLKSGKFQSAGNSTINLNIDSAFADSIHFYLAISADELGLSVGRFEFYIDNKLKYSRDSQLSWTEIVIGFESGVHQFSWKYQVDETEITNNPAVYLDEIKLK